MLYKRRLDGNSETRRETLIKFHAESQADSSASIVSKLSWSPTDRKEAVWSVFKRGKRAA